MSSNLTIEELSTWSENSLKVYLNVRGKDTTGSFTELVARAFVASSENAEVDPQKEHEERTILAEYQSKLIIGDVSIPDPLNLKLGWVGEKNGITNWPTLIYRDIAEYLKMLGPEFIEKLEREYKLGKAFRYFDCEFVREIYYNDIEKDSPYCLLRCRVVPSQRTSAKPYYVWVCILKDQNELPGGQILNSYCTCTAGLKGTCNHVVALLFRVDNAVMTGVTNPSKTSKLCQWNIPSGSKVNIEPAKISDMVFKKSHYTSASDRDFTKEKESHLNFSTTLHQDQLDKLADESTCRNNFNAAIKKSAAKSRFAELMEGSPLNRPENVSCDLPKTLMEKVEQYDFNENESISINVQNFTSTLKLTKQQITDVQNVTSKQNINTEWGEYRTGRLTASAFHRINSRSVTLQKKGGDATALVNQIIGKSRSVSTKEMKYGKALEPHGVRKYTYVMTKSRSHANFKVNHIGLVIDEKHPYIAVSPDMQISCDCCGMGVLELKCPYSSRDMIPSPDVLPYLALHENEDKSAYVTLDKSHQYYYQIQGQMAVTKTSYCDFFVYSKHGQHLERIEYQPDFWDKTLPNLTWFWFNCVAPVLVTKEKCVVENPVDNLNDVELRNDNEIINDRILNPKPNEKPKEKPNTSSKNQSTLVADLGTSAEDSSEAYDIDMEIDNNSKCGKCYKDLLDSPKYFKDESIQCDSCSVWYHFMCAGFKVKKSKPESDATWYCKNCKTPQ